VLALGVASLSPEAVPFCDLRAAHRERAEATEAALLRVARSGRYVLGPELEQFENEFARCCQVEHVVGVGSGTAALALLLRAAGIGRGDEVVVPAYTAAATWMAVALTGARPIGADVDPDTGAIDPQAAAAAVSSRTAGVIGVHLFGRLAPIALLRALTDRHGLLLIEDAAHAPGVDEGHGPAGSLADAAAFSFYPTKTLGALGDGGAVATDSEEIARSVRRLRSYGWSEWQGQAATVGGNSRLDEIQAAVLRGRLAQLPNDHTRLRALAECYRRGLEGLGTIAVPALTPSGEAPWHQFVIGHEDRDGLREHLAARGIGTAIHYQPLPPALEAFAAGEHFAAAERLAGRALSLPFDPWVSRGQAEIVCAAVAARSGSSERSRTRSAGS
jgi:dTDP-3-amino-3,4,6-trideoxy-alpha-D-glucose transaminase